MLFNFIFLIFGLLIVVVGADYFVAGSSLIAKRFGVPRLIIGLTIVAIGTSAPEFAINIISSLHGHNDLALGNILGSNISNILLIFGGASLFVRKVTISKNSLLQIFISFLVSIIITFITFAGFGTSMHITMVEGIILFILGLIYWVYLYKITRSDTTEELNEPEGGKLHTLTSIWLISIITIIGLVALLYGSKMVTDSAVAIAEMLHIPQLVISGTIIAIGTSLPELVTSIQAVRRGYFDMMIGNIVGSNIVNTLFILSTSAIIKPISISSASHAYLLINIAAALLLLLGFILFNKRLFKRWQGIVFLILYVGFLLYNFI